MTNDNTKVVDAQFEEVKPAEKEATLNNVIIKMNDVKETIYSEPNVKQIGLNSDFVTLIREAQNENEVNQTIIYNTKNVNVIVVNEIPATKKTA